MENLSKRKRARQLALHYAWRFLGTPYYWGGDDPMAGFDCSGLIVEILQAVGLLPHRSDYDAGGLWDLFKAHEVPAGYTGCLVFWFNASNYPMHIEIMLNDTHTIGASGGGGATTSLAAAIQANAFIKIRPITYRGPGYRILDPFLEIKE